MKAQIISIIIILVAALFFATFGLLIHNQEAKLKNYFKWPPKRIKFKK